MNSQTVNVVKVSETKKQDGYLDSRVVLWKDNKGTFVTHVETFENGRSSFIWGHYDMSLDSAISDFNKRVESL